MFTNFEVDEFLPAQPTGCKNLVRELHTSYNENFSES